MEQVVSMLTGTGDVIRAPLSKISGAEHQYLNLGKRPKKDMGGRDLLFAVDQQLFDAGKVFVQSGLDFGSKQERPTNDTRIAVMAATSLTQESSRAAISGFLSNVGILLMDEAMNRSGGEHQRLVTKYSHDEKHPPIAVVSTAHDPKKNGGLGYDVKLSHFEAEMGVNTEPAILEPMRMKVVPHRGQILYRSGTFESADQLLRAYDESLPLLKASGQEQPNFGHHIVAVDRNIVPYMMILMQQRHLHTGVQCVSYEDNTDEQFAATIQAAMNNPNAAPICLVTAPGSILDSYDFVELAGLYVGADLNTENLRRIIGRLLHTRKKNGGTVMVQRFAKSAPVSQVPWGVYTPDLSIDPQSQSQKFVDGQYFLGAKAVAREQDVLKAGKFRSREHLTNVSSRVFDELTPSETGHYPPTINAQRDIRASFGVQFPPIARKKSVLSEDYMREFAELNGVTYEDLAKEMNETVKKLSDLERLRSALARVRCKAIPQFGNRPWKEYAGKSQGRNRSPSYKGNGHSLTPAVPMGKRERKTGVDGPRAPDHDNRLRLMERRREQGLDIFGAEDYLLKPESADEATSA
jgi:hypothetical protein